MKKLLFLLILATGNSYAQSPFDGTWVIQSDPSQLPQKPVEYLLASGMFRCRGCIANMEIKADGRDHKIEETNYWDTASVRIVDAHTAEITMKKFGKTMFTEIDTVTGNGAALTQLLKDDTEAQTVTTETVFRRVEQGSANGHAISGSWLAYKTTTSKNDSTIKYKCTADAFSVETPLGEKFDAKFDGEDYPVIDDPGHSMVSVRRMGPMEVEITSKHNGKVVGILHLTAEADGETLRVSFENKESNTTETYQMRRER
jgi:hypothetical protein